MTPDAADVRVEDTRHAVDPFWSVTQLLDQLDSGATTCTAVVRTVLDRIARHDPSLHAFVTVLTDEALAQAARCDQDRARGRRLGPLHGVPVSIKDLMLVRGAPLTAQSRAMPGARSASDATPVARLREAGAVILGTNSLWEFACGVPSHEDPLPPACNPWSLAHSPGGSSSGSGAAVAAGLSFAALGTDTGGSVRHPASVCGLVGMKPTYGLVSQAGVVPLSPSLDHVGPLTRTVRDNALVLRVIAGHDPADPLSVAPPAGLDIQSGIGLPIEGLRTGVPVNLIDRAAHDPEVLEAFDCALSDLQALGLRIESFELPDAHAVHGHTGAILEYEIWRVHRERMRKHADRYGAGLRDRLLQASGYSRADCERARRFAMGLARQMDALLSKRFDVLLMPGREAPAMTLDELMAQQPTARGRMTRLGNLTGLPALVMPMGFTTSGLPVSLQVMARHFSEPMIYRVAAAYEAVRPWHLTHPDWLTPARDDPAVLPASGTVPR